MMARRMKPVDAVVVGVGWAGSIIAKEMAVAGMQVVGLERGQPRDTVPDFQGGQIHDELRYAVRLALMQDAARETLTFRNRESETALPVRRFASFLPGMGLGGAGVHWNGHTWRFYPEEFVIRSRTEERYGRDFIDPELNLQDWGLTYDELEPYYDRFEYLCGISGVAGNLKGEKQRAGNPFEGPRARGYPTPPLKDTYSMRLFREAAVARGYQPFPVPAANLSQPYTNPEGMSLKPCMYCGFCERFGCEHYAKSSPQTCILPKLLAQKNFELRTGAHVTRVLTDSAKRRATGVVYVNGNGEEIEQPAELVVLTTFAYHNVRMLLVSGIGKPYDPRTNEGVVGRNYTYQTNGAVAAFFDESVNINPFMSAGSTGMVVGDYVADGFDHAPHRFIGGATLASGVYHGRPIEFHPVPPGTPRWGAAWKSAVARHYNHTVTIGTSGSSLPSRRNFLDLDPTYRDAWGMPLVRMTFDFPENDLRMSAFVTAKAREIAEAMGAKQVTSTSRRGPYTMTQYQSTHNTGGAIMGADPRTSVLNKYQQCWDVPNLFVVGASGFAHNPAFNPTGTVGALAYWAAEAITQKYRRAPGPLVQV
jgi:gluconate 2-dehydrogenase alpha chain